MLAMIGPQVMAFVAKNYPQRMMGKIGGSLIGNIATIGGLVGAGIASYSLHLTGYYTATFNIFLAAAVIGFVGGLAMISPKIFTQWETERVADNNREADPASPLAK
jgi:MFS family permease